MAKPPYDKKRPDIRWALDHGWHFSGHSGGHLVFKHDDAGRRTTLPNTPSDWRGFRNTIARMRRMTPTAAPA
ncbi:type II toxin-antitoxin system HicA family toxin [Nocardia cyriacigeorgica]|uniref:type II toxin-antitoxin system HicA family toxin n=1 Tax=Nocardia cyriacigeorgica TaxID=135487 RepID=UPI001894F818|nr:type II toxin-antitoxin system HicA family toxin [Nocardia cyriacigeorgica]MBF6085119.1 type II toxin-antitoxin system HicA family toxin [Nocardia cyriacigeorgica]